jgi:aspartyl-tRNA synthetase
MEELEADLSTATISKKQLNKEARKAAKAAKAEKSQAEEEDPFAANYGDVPVEEI